MEIRQLRSLVTLAEMEFSVSRTAAHLHLVQPAVSQHLRRLEAELGGPLVRRQGKRLIGFTELGEQVVAHARAILTEFANIGSLAKGQPTTGVLRIAVSASVPRPFLSAALHRFHTQYPGIQVQIDTGTLAQLWEKLRQDRADLALYSGSPASEFASLPGYRWRYGLIAAHGHPILAQQPLTLERLWEHPLVTYLDGALGRSRFSDAFAREGLRPQLSLAAPDAETIKHYVRQARGIGILASLAYDPALDGDLALRDLSHLFAWETLRIAYAKDRHLRDFQRDCIRCFQEQSPNWSEP